MPPTHFNHIFYTIDTEMRVSLAILSQTLQVGWRNQSITVDTKKVTLKLLL
jgi:hypothetical protein